MQVFFLPLYYNWAVFLCPTSQLDIRELPASGEVSLSVILSNVTCSPRPVEPLIPQMEFIFVESSVER